MFDNYLYNSLSSHLPNVLHPHFLKFYIRYKWWIRESIPDGKTSYAVLVWISVKKIFINAAGCVDPSEGEVLVYH